MIRGRDRSYSLRTRRASYVFDPRRVLNDPTLWLIAPAILALGAISRAKFTKRRHFTDERAHMLFLTAMASLSFNFARTLPFREVWMGLLGINLCGGPVQYDLRPR